MVICPKCDAEIDVEEPDVDEGDTISCDECGAELRVAGVNPLELEAAGEGDDEEDEEGFFDEDGEEEEEEEEEEDWR